MNSLMMNDSALNIIWRKRCEDEADNESDWAGDTHAKSYNYKSVNMSCQSSGD